MKSITLSEVQTLADYLAKHHKQPKCKAATVKSYGIGFDNVPHVHIVERGSGWSINALAIDASGADSKGVEFAFALAREVARGWRSIVVATRGSFVVFAGGKMVGRAYA